MSDISDFDESRTAYGQVVLAAKALGVQPPRADWGLMLADGQEVMREAPHVTIIPGLAILTAAVAFNLLSDGLRDLFDPRMQC